MVKKWLIIGGGIQGCTLATYLVKSKKVKARDIYIIDPHERPLFLWERKTSLSG